MKKGARRWRTGTSTYSSSMPDPLSVVGAIIVHEGRVFAARRALHKSAGGLWEFPGGKLEPGEAPIDALIRELREELAVDVDVTGFAARATTPVDGVPIDLACYWADVRGPRPSRSTDHDALRWLAPTELDSVAWSPADIPIMAAIKPDLDHTWQAAPHD